MNDSNPLSSEIVVSALGGIIGTLAIKEFVSRFLRRKEYLETKWDDRHEALISALLGEVKGLHTTIARVLERMDGQRTTIDDTKSKVEDHCGRISALEVGHADLRARLELTADRSRDD